MISWFLGFLNSIRPWTAYAAGYACHLCQISILRWGFKGLFSCRRCVCALYVILSVVPLILHLEQACWSSFFSKYAWSVTDRLVRGMRLQQINKRLGLRDRSSSVLLDIELQDGIFFSGFNSILLGHWFMPPGYEVLLGDSLRFDSLKQSESLPKELF